MSARHERARDPHVRPRVSERFDPFEEVSAPHPVRPASGG
jgi:hypothetical protein